MENANNYIKKRREERTYVNRIFDSNENYALDMTIKILLAMTVINLAGFSHSNLD